MDDDVARDTIRDFQREVHSLTLQITALTQQRDAAREALADVNPTTLLVPVADTYNRFMLYTSDDKDDMEYPVSTTIPRSVHDTYEEALAAWNDDAEEDFGAIVETTIIVKATTRLVYVEPDPDDGK